MIHPTRTNLLLLKDKAHSIAGSVGILTARRLALIREILAISTPFLRSREEVKSIYSRALMEIALSRGYEGDDFVLSLREGASRNLDVVIRERNIIGLRYREISVRGDIVRRPDEYGYDMRFTTPHLEEAIHLFEKIVDQMLEIAAFEIRVKRIGDEIIRVTRRIRVLEQRVLPGLQKKIKNIAQYIGERERESFYRLKRFKSMRQA
jgi:V/A-type H+/Na+-transporting ATPase subunit D